MREKATFGMGCFWKPQLIFDKVPGIIKTQVGYMGGNEEQYPYPTYEQVCSDKTGYAEVIHIIFNFNKISYKQLLNIFWTNHNPTTKNRQGNDIGDQYRSIIFFHSREQEKTAKTSLEEKQREMNSKILFNKKIATEIKPASKFFPAEDYHQKFLEKKGRKSCSI